MPVAPALVVAEAVAAGWVLELLGLPATSGVGFVTGCQMAHVTCLAAARHAVFAAAGWNVEADGLQGAPGLRVLAGANAHVTIARACRLLGLGADRVRIVAADREGRMIPAELEAALGEHEGPQIVCAQAGDVNSGAFDPLAAIVAICHERGAWCHVDGAFGLWAAASPARRGAARRATTEADSWATDAHKWLNVPYDCGIAIVADTARQHGAMSMSADYIPAHDEGVPWGIESTPEFSRRARGIPLYAALRALGRAGVTDLVDRCCDHARLMADRLAADDGVEVLNDVVLNQVLVRFGDDDAHTEAVIDEVQRDGTCWVERQPLARPRGHAHLGRRLADDDRRRRALGGGDPRGSPVDLDWMHPAALARGRSSCMHLRRLLSHLSDADDGATLAREGGRAFVSASLRPYVLAALADEDRDRPTLVVAGDDRQARDLAVDLRAWLHPRPVRFYPSRGVAYESHLAPPPHLVGLRVAALDALLADPGAGWHEAPVVVVSAVALSEKVPDPELRPRSFTLRTGELLDLDECMAELVAAGYERVDQVDDRGQFAARGGLLDIYPATEDRAVRVDLFDVEIESLRWFSTFTQRSLGEAEEVEIAPAAELAAEHRELAEIAALESEEDRPDIAELLPVERFRAFLDLAPDAARAHRRRGGDRPRARRPLAGRLRRLP